LQISDASGVGLDEPRSSSAACGLGRAGADVIRAAANSACPVIPLAFVAIAIVFSLQIFSVADRSAAASGGPPREPRGARLR
jgi:hypothetical protein